MPSLFRQGIWVPLVLLLVLVGGVAEASETTERRMQISLTLFPRIVAVDEAFRDKLTKDNAVRLAFIYVAEKAVAEELVTKISQSMSNVAGYPLEAVAVTFGEQLTADSIMPTAIFVAERLADEAFAKILSYANSKHILLFSPFSDDVERGAMVGISVTSRVRPYFNVRTLAQAGISINAMLMKLSARYE